MIWRVKVSGRSFGKLADIFTRLASPVSVGDDDLLHLYRSLGESDKRLLLVALRDESGNAGVELLRTVAIDKNEDGERRYAAIYGLVKSAGSSASDIFILCLASKDKDLREFAIFALAVVGDGAAWDQVFAMLDADIITQNPVDPSAMPFATLSLQSTVIPKVCYVGRHLEVVDLRDRVVELIRSNWAHLYNSEQQWFDIFWPACNPREGDTVPRNPDPKELSRWAEDPLLE
jgi:hypothetical protein